MYLERFGFFLQVDLIALTKLDTDTDAGTIRYGYADT